MAPLDLIRLAAEEGWAEEVRRLLSDSPWLAPGAVFVGGLITALNPCVLATVPLVVAFVGGREDASTARRGLVLSLAFVAGLSLAFAALGVVAALAGRLLGDVGPFWDYLVLVVCLLMGAHLVGLLEVPMPNLSVSPRWRGIPGALALGALFGVVSTPCATPVLVVLLAYVASSGASVAWGGFLLVVYALGHGALLLAAGASAGAARALLSSPALARAGGRIRVAAGLLIAAVGVFIFLSRS